MARYNEIDADSRPFTTNDNLRDRDFLEFQYYRSAYAAYPRRVYCGDSNRVVNTGRDLAEMHFDPDEAWLDGHAIGTIVTYRVTETDELKREIVSRTNASTKAFLPASMKN